MTSSPGAADERDRRLRQQEVIADLGQRALETDDLDQLMHDASATVANTLDNEYCKVLELLPSGDEVFLRHGVGWDDGIVGEATVPTERDSQAGYTLITEEPVVVDDLRSEDRFSGPELLTNHDVVSGISVIIGSVDNPWGILGTHTTQRREFSELDANFVQSVANILASAIRTTEREAELERTIDLLHKTERIADVGGWEIDAETMDVFWTDHIFKVLGMAPGAEPSLDEAVGMYHPDDRETVEAAIEEGLNNGEPFDIEARIRTWEDEVRWLHLQGVPEFAGDEVVALRGAAQDITTQKERERELETLFQVLPVGVIVAEDDGNMVKANDIAHRIWGGDVFDAATVEEYEQYPVRQADSGEDVPPDQMTLARVVDGQEVLEPDIYEIDTVDGEQRIIELYGMPIRDETGAVTRGVVTLNDITDRRETQRQVKTSERRYRTLVEHFPDGAVGLFDHDLTYTAVGGELLEEVGVTPEERIGGSVHDIYPDHLIEEIEPHFETALQGEAHEFEVEFHDRHLLVHTLPIGDPDDVFGGMLVVQDITERREYQHQLEQSNERLEQFAYAASHDLQEPLRMVSSYLQLVERRYADAIDEEGAEYIEFAVNGADRMRAMVNGLLQYSRVETAGERFAPVDLNAVVEDVCEDLYVRLEESEAEITVDSLPDVHGDGDQLRQVFQNLLTNALDYSGDEPPHVHITANPTDGGWTVSVADEGIGIDPENHEHIFEVFQTVRGPDEASGTGIGLALCERIIERHNGDIWVDSVPGEGATFSFDVPAVPEDTADD